MAIRAANHRLGIIQDSGINDNLSVESRAGIDRLPIDRTRLRGLISQLCMLHGLKKQPYPTPPVVRGFTDPGPAAVT